MITSLSAKLKDQIVDMSKKISDLFKTGKSLNVKDAWKVLGTTFLLDLIEDIRTIAVGLIKVFMDVVRVTQSSINKSVNIPVFSALFRKITNTDLSVISGLALILAIPTTIVLKLVTEKAPPDMTNVKYTDLLAGTTSKQQGLDFNFFGGVTGSVANGFAGALAAVPSVPLLAFNRTFSHAKVMKKGEVLFPVKAIERTAVRPNCILPHPNGRLSQYLGVEPELDFNWGSFLGMLVNMAMIPIGMDKSVPGYGLRWGSWFISSFVNMFGVAVNPHHDIRAIAWAVIVIAMGITNFALCITYRVEEIEASKVDFPAKDDLYSIEMIVAAVLDLVSTICDKAAFFDVGMWIPPLIIWSFKA